MFYHLWTSTVCCEFPALYHPFFASALTATLLDGHAIYLLNLLLAFLQPKFDPSLQEDLLADEIEEGGSGVDESGGSGSPGGMGGGLGEQSGDDEFRPFVRRLPEWQFWWARLLSGLESYAYRYHTLTPTPIRLSSTRATVVALLCTTSEIFDVPVYWPILVCYFFVLFALTMRRQIQWVFLFFFLIWPAFPAILGVFYIIWC